MQRADQTGPIRTPTKTGQGFQYRHVGLAGAVLLDTLTTRDAYAAARDCSQKRLHQRGFADAGLSGDEDHARDAALDLGKPILEPLQLTLAPDHRARRHRGEGQADRPGVQSDHPRRPDLLAPMEDLDRDLTEQQNDEAGG